MIKRPLNVIIRSGLDRFGYNKPNQFKFVSSVIHRYNHYSANVILPSSTRTKLLNSCDQLEQHYKFQKRHLSSGESNDEESSKEYPLLMHNMLPRGMPNLWYSIKNFYIINFILRAQIDKNFELTSFIKGARHAFLTVSSHLANNRLEDLEGLVDSRALEEISENYKYLNVTQRRELEMKETDIVLSFAHNIRIETMKEGFTGTHKHIVYIFLVFDCIRNLEDILKEKSVKGQGSARELFHEFHQRKYICNYEFKREYIEGKECGDWIITKLLHIPERDLLNYLRR